MAVHKHTALTARLVVVVALSLQGCESKACGDIKTKPLCNPDRCAWSDTADVQCATKETCEGLDAGTPETDMEEIPTAEEYATALGALNIEDVKKDVKKLLTNSQDCWPADFKNYGPFFIRLAWHCSGSYRETDGKGGCTGGKQRFEPERSWDDNTNLDKARGLLAPIKKKYGAGLSWGDLFITAGTTALREMGTPVKHLCFGRMDEADGTSSLELGPSDKAIPCKVNGQCEKPYGSTTVGLIYLNPEGPVEQGHVDAETGVWNPSTDQDAPYVPNPDPAKSAKDIRDSFGRMNHSDRATVALIGGGHAFGKTHGACPEGAGKNPEQAYKAGLKPWQGGCGTGKGADAFTSGFEGQWTTDPLVWDNEYFTDLLSKKWEKHVGPGGHWQWRIKDLPAGDPVLFRLTSDIALLEDPEYLMLVKEFAKDMKAFNEAFDEAWTKLTTLGGTWSSAQKCDSVEVIPPFKMLATDAQIVV